ncbi:type II toxin-antitoxin system HicB family antitoxin [Nocardia sp. NPDC059177]|uniref:type II toxin-antitoxin system HicB family antitoxin n=1 Tax=Nocardia sp. NPDC059177 TaxID=3346759 RepID=UPI0036A1A012
MSKIYDVQITRDGRWWMVHIPELDELTQARRLSEAPAMAREVIALHTGTPLSEVVVEVEIAVADIPVSRRAGVLAEHRREAVRLEQLAAAEARELARELARQQVPVRDIGEILGVSHQRAQQLTSA